MSVSEVGFGWLSLESEAGRECFLLFLYSLIMVFVVIIVRDFILIIVVMIIICLEENLSSEFALECVICIIILETVL